MVEAVLYQGERSGGEVRGGVPSALVFVSIPTKVERNTKIELSITPEAVSVWPA